MQIPAEIVEAYQKANRSNSIMAMVPVYNLIKPIADKHGIIMGQTEVPEHWIKK